MARPKVMGRRNAFSPLVEEAPSHTAKSTDVGRGGPEARGALSHVDVSVLRLLLHEHSTGQNLPTRLALHLLCSPRELQHLDQAWGRAAIQRTLVRRLSSCPNLPTLSSGVTEPKRASLTPAQP